MRTTVMASMALNRLGPRAAARAMVSTREGTDSTMSVQRMMTVSTTPPTEPEKQPSTEPVMPDTGTTNRATATDWRLPYRIRLNRSRPTSSVPNQ